MKNENEKHVDGLRIQDAVARIAGTDLRTTVRVLYALEVAARCNNDDELATELSAVLKRSVDNGPEPSALFDKPSQEAVEACNQHFKRVLRRFDWKYVRPLQRLEACPYHTSRLIDDVMSD